MLSMQMQHSTKFTDMMAENENKLIDIAKNSTPFDWEHGLDAFIGHLRWMRDFYRLGEGVAAKENSGERTRLETIELALSYYDKWINSEKNFIWFVETREMKPNDNGTDTVEKMGRKCVYKYGSAKRTYKKLCKYQQKNKKLFFKTLYKYMETWWD